MVTTKYVCNWELVDGATATFNTSCGKEEVVSVPSWINMVNNDVKSDIAIHCKHCGNVIVLPKTFTTKKIVKTK